MPDVNLPKLKVLAVSLWLHLRNIVSRQSVTGGDGPVVSLTSYGGRVRRVHLTIESIARGTRRPARFILWLDDGIETMPAVLRRRGLEVRRTTDWGSHKKYFPYCLEWADDGRTLVTADDDVIYPRWWLARLFEAVTGDPDSVWCDRSRRVAFNPDGSPALYAAWLPNQSTTPSLANLATGVSGVAYPPRLQRIMRDAGTDFTENCLRTDDIWLHVHEVRHGIRVAQVSDEPLIFPTQLQSQRQALATENTIHGGNDVAIAATYSPEDCALLRETVAASPT